MATTRGGRRVRVPRFLENFIPTSHGTLPSQYASLIPDAPSPIQSAPSMISETTTSSIGVVYDTEPDGFGVFRRYNHIPKEDPEAELSLDWSCDAPGLEQADERADEATRSKSIAWLAGPVKRPTAPSSCPYTPFDNASQFRLCDYFYSRSDVKSQAAFDDFVHMLQSRGFRVEDLEGFSAKKAERLLDEWIGSPDGVFSGDDGWTRTSVFIPLPKVGSRYRSEDDAPKAEVRGVVHRRLLDLIRGVVTDTTSRFAKHQHWIPHIRWWIPDMPEQRTPTTGDGMTPEFIPASPMSTSPRPASSPPPSSTSSHSHGPPPPIRVYTDCYNSNAMLDEDEKIHRMPRIAGDDPDMEYAVLPLLVWSDETHLSSFGSAALWPIYIYFGNISKYLRGRPSEFMAQHLAYIPQVGLSISVALYLRSLTGYCLSSRIP